MGSGLQGLAATVYTLPGRDKRKRYLAFDGATTSARLVPGSTHTSNAVVGEELTSTLRNRTPWDSIVKHSASGSSGAGTEPAPLP